MARSDRTPGIRPRPSIGRSLDIAWRYAFPGATSLVFMVLALAPFGIWRQSALLPVVALTCVWFWSLYRPDAMGPPMVLVLGLLLDLLAYLPLGVGPLTLLTTHGLAQRLRRMLARHGFAAVWPIFTTVACFIAIMNWALVSLLTFRLYPPGPVLFQAGLAAALYPVVAIPLMLAHSAIADPERA